MAIHPHILLNGEIRRASESSLFPGQLGLLSGWGVFSTLRAMDGYLFAWERHWARMSRDASLLNVPMPADPGQVERDLMRLIAVNATGTGAAGGNCTVRIVVVRNSGGLWDGPGSGLPSDAIALTTDLKRWGESVRLDIQPNGRYAAGEFTSAKTLSWAANLRWYERAHENGFDEVVLLNERGQVAECTSANIFAVFGDEVRTPPVGDGCLPGVTRGVLLEAIRIPRVTLAERSLTLEELYAADEVCITSSTRGLLTVSEIGGTKLNRTSDVCERLSRAFEGFLRTDITRRASPAPASPSPIPSPMAR